MIDLEGLGIEEMQRRRNEDAGKVIARWQQHFDLNPNHQNCNHCARCAPERGIARAAEGGRGHDRQCQHQGAFMRQRQREQHQKYTSRSDDTAPRVVRDGERRPEKRVRHPHLGREAEYERAEQGGRETGVSENSAAFRTVGREGREQPDQRRNVKQEIRRPRCRPRDSGQRRQTVLPARE